MIVLANYHRFVDFIDLVTGDSVSVPDPRHYKKSKGFFNYSLGGVFMAIYVDQGKMFFRYEKTDYEIDENISCESQILSQSAGRFSLYSNESMEPTLLLDFDFWIDEIGLRDPFRLDFDDLIIWGELLKRWMREPDRSRIIQACS